MATRRLPVLLPLLGLLCVSRSADAVGILGAPNAVGILGAPGIVQETATGTVEGNGSAARMLFLPPAQVGREGTTRVVVRKQDATESFDLPGSWWMTYAQKSARYVLFGVGPAGGATYIKTIQYIDEATLTLSDSQHGLARDSWIARAAQLRDDGEYVAFVGRRGADVFRLWVLQTSTDTLRPVGPPPPPVPAEPGAYDPLPKDWSEESFNDVMELAPGLISFPKDDVVQVVYGDPSKSRGKTRNWALSRVFPR